MVERRIRALDESVDQLGLVASDVEGLGQVCHELSVNPRLRITLSDGAIAPEGRAALAASLIGPRLGERVAQVLGLVAAVATGTEDLEAQMARQADRAVLRTADDLTRVREEIASLVSSLRATPQLASALTDPATELPARRELVDRLLASRMSAATIALMHRAIEHRRLVPRLEQLGELTAQVAGRELARVRAAAPLTPDQTTRLSTELDRILGTTVDLQVTIDPEVLGGLYVQVGDQVIDGTIRTRLDNARRLIG